MSFLIPNYTYEKIPPKLLSKNYLKQPFHRINNKPMNVKNDINLG